MSNDDETEKSADSAPDSNTATEAAWQDDDRVKITASHIEFQIYAWAPSPKKMRRDLERDNKDNRPPDSIKIRKLVTVEDTLALGDYDYGTTYGMRVALACILTGEMGGSDGRLNFDMAKRASYADWTIVDKAIQDLIAGKMPAGKG